MLQAPRRGDHEIRRAIALAVEVTKHLGGEARHRLPGAQDGVAVGMSPPEGLPVEVEDQVLRRVLHHGDLLQDHVPFQHQILLSQEGVPDQVRQHFHRQGEVEIQGPGLEGGVLPGRVGVQRAAHGLQRQGDLPCGAPVRPLEDHMLQHVAGPHDGGLLVDDALGRPHPHRHRSQPLDSLRQDPQSVREGGEPDVAAPRFRTEDGLRERHGGRSLSAAPPGT